jgi:hypothetical protein
MILKPTNRISEHPLLGNKITQADVLALIENLRKAGHLAIGEKGAVTYALENK